jgi:electron transfer flavoprotein beta subunit
MKAKKKPLKTIDGMADEWQTLLKPRLHILEVNEPKKREGGKKVESVDEVRFMR